MTLYCFDVDGTLLTEEMKGMGQYVEGIIPTEELIKLEKQGHTVVIVSPSPYLPKRYTDANHWFKRNGSNDYRWENIQDAQIAHGIPVIETVYIDDLESNRNNVKIYVKESYSPEEFMELLNKGSII